MIIPLLGYGVEHNPEPIDGKPCTREACGSGKRSHGFSCLGGDFNCQSARTLHMHLRNLTAMAFELRLNVGPSAPNGRAETCAARRLSPVLFENKATLQEASAPDKSFFRKVIIP